MTQADLQQIQNLENQIQDLENQIQDLDNEVDQQKLIKAQINSLLDMDQAGWAMEEALKFKEDVAAFKEGLGLTAAEIAAIEAMNLGQNYDLDYSRTKYIDIAIYFIALLCHNRHKPVCCILYLCIPTQWFVVCTTVDAAPV